MSETTTPTELEDLPVWHRACAEPITLQVATDLAEQLCMVLIERDALLVSHQCDAPALSEVIAPAVEVLREACATSARAAEAAGMLAHHTHQDVSLLALLNTAAHLAYSLGRADAARAYAEEAIERGHGISDVRLSVLVLGLLSIACPWPGYGSGDRLILEQLLAEHRRSQA